MRVIHVASEAAPYSQTGGLGQVVGALPLAQERAAAGIDVAILTPLYPSVAKAVADEGDSLVDTAVGLTVPLGGTSYQARVVRSRNRPQFVFVDCPVFFDRTGLYADSNGVAWSDNAERFALLSRVAVERGHALMGGAVDVLHAHDWQAGLAAAYLALGGPRPVTVFTIHNLAFQGVFHKDKLPALGLDWSLFTPDGLEFYDQIAFLKAGAAFSDAITTVSPSYAREIQTVEFGCGLHGFFAANSDRLTGILNGIDTDAWNPQTDPLLAANFSAAKPEGKEACRAALAELFDLPAPRQELLCGVVTRLTAQKGPELIAELVPMLSSIGARMIILGSGDRDVEKRFETLGRWFRHHLSVRIGFDEGTAHRIFAGSDAFVMPSRFEPCGLGQMIAMRYGALPVVHSVGGLADTVKDPGDWARVRGDAGTGYRFDNPDQKGLEWAVGRAATLRRTAPALWRRDVQEAMSADWSWARAAKRYLDLYRALIVAVALVLCGCPEDPPGVREPTQEERAAFIQRRWMSQAKIDIAGRFDRIAKLLDQRLPADASHELEELRSRYPFLDNDPGALDPEYARSVDFGLYHTLRQRVEAPVADSKGWRNTRWGMTRKEVLGAYPDASARGDELVAPVSFFGKPTEARFRFEDDGLVEVEVRTWVESDRDALELRNLLHYKYGKPNDANGYGTASTVVELRGDPGAYRPYLVYRSRSAAAPVAEASVSFDDKLGDL